MVRFSAPEDIAGTAFLMREHEGAHPSSTCISPGSQAHAPHPAGSERESSFMRSDFTYADMQPVDPKFAHNVRNADEKVGDDDCFVLETTIESEGGPAVRKVRDLGAQEGLRRAAHALLRQEGKPVKTLYARKVSTIEGKPVVVEARMQSENSHATELLIDEHGAQGRPQDSAVSPPTPWSTCRYDARVPASARAVAVARAHS